MTHQLRRRLRHVPEVRVAEAPEPAARRRNPALPPPLYDPTFSRAVWRLCDGAKGLVVWYAQTAPGWMDCALARRSIRLTFRGAREEGAAEVGLYPLVTFQYSATTLYQVSYHIQYLFF
jgi:hypothetical protein